MPRKKAAAEAAAAGGGARADHGARERCDHATCRKPLTAILHCARCKEAVYCCKECQRAAWKAGHKKECVPAARPVLPGSSEDRLLSLLNGLIAAQNWPGAVALERAALELATAVRGVQPEVCGFIYSALGNANMNLSNFARAFELHTERKAVAEESGDRAGVSEAYGNLGNCCRSTGKYERAIELHLLSQAIKEELGDLAGMSGTLANLGAPPRIKYVYMYICIYVYMYICIYVYVYTFEYCNLSPNRSLLHQHGTVPAGD
jgi:tetratricopeptide (TPR) repeat protein